MRCAMRRCWCRRSPASGPRPGSLCCASTRSRSTLILYPSLFGVAETGRSPSLPILYIVSMKLRVNGEERATSARTLAALVDELGMKADRVAVELNRDIVPRAHWEATQLRDGDELEIVHFVGGG